MAAPKKAQPTTPDRLLTIPEVATRLGISRTSVYDFFADGRLTRNNIGTPEKPRMRVKESVLTAYIERSTLPAPSRQRPGRAA